MGISVFNFYKITIFKHETSNYGKIVDNLFLMRILFLREFVVQMSLMILSYLKQNDVTRSLWLFNQYGILCFNIGLHCFHFLRILTFSWSRCEDYPSSIETASD